MQIIKKIYYKIRLDVAWGKAMSAWERRHWHPFYIMSASETVDYILQHGSSLARFGDGELQIAAYGCALKFQRADPVLQAHLIRVMHSRNQNLLLCLPNRINMVKPCQQGELTDYWKKALRQHLHAWTRELERNRCYGDTNLTRLTDGNTEKAKRDMVEKIKKIWECRNVVLIEGEKTRFGVGNSLLDRAYSVQRILGPAESAYDSYQKLFTKSREVCRQMNNPLVLLALGPTATVLASDLADNGIQAIDLGHLDICYEHLNRGSDGAVPGKYTNEAVGGSKVDDCLDEKYLQQIVFRVR